MRIKKVLRRDEIMKFITRLYDGICTPNECCRWPMRRWGCSPVRPLAVHAIGQGLAQAMGKLSKHGVKQVDRLLSNEGIEVGKFFGYWVPYMVGARTEVVVALDWTSFARDGHETIVLSMLTGHGRATPLLWKTVEASKLKGKRNAHEDALLYRLYEVVPEGVKVTVVADRGFADCSLFEHLAGNLGFEYVIRLRGNIYVTNAKGEKRKASQWVGVGGRSRTLRDAVVTDSKGLGVGTVVCVQDKEMKEPWCLVASERKVATRTLIRYYAKRWGLRRAFATSRICALGWGFLQCGYRKPSAGTDCSCSVALAIALLTVLGAAGESLGYDRWLKANTVKYRTPLLVPTGFDAL